MLPSTTTKGAERRWPIFVLVVVVLVALALLVEAFLRAESFSPGEELPDPGIQDISVSERDSLYRPPDNGSARAYSFAVPPRSESDPDENSDESSFIQVHATGMEPGTYLVRVQVDGARSPLRFNTDLGRYDLPQVTIR